ANALAILLSSSTTSIFFICVISSVDFERPAGANVAAPRSFQARFHETEMISFPGCSVARSLHSVKRFQKLSGWTRLGQQGKGRECESLFHQLALCVTCVNNDRNTTPILLDLLERTRTIEVGHCQIEHNKVGRFLAHPFQGFQAPCGCMHIVSVPFQ